MTRLTVANTEALCTTYGLHFVSAKSSYRAYSNGSLVIEATTLKAFYADFDKQVWLKGQSSELPISQPEVVTQETISTTDEPTVDTTPSSKLSLDNKPTTKESRKMPRLTIASMNAKAKEINSGLEVHKASKGYILVYTSPNDGDFEVAKFSTLAPLDEYLSSNKAADFLMATGGRTLEQPQVSPQPTVAAQLLEAVKELNRTAKGFAHNAQAIQRQLRVSPSEFTKAVNCLVKARNLRKVANGKSLALIP